MKKLFLLLFSVLAFTSQVRADVEWTIWEGETAGGNVQGKSKLDFSILEEGDMICVYGTGTLSKAIYRISGSNWETWTHLESYVPAVDATYGYYHVVTTDFLTNFKYSEDDTKTWAVGNWDTGTITKVTIKKAKSAIRTTLSSVTKEDNTFEYTIPKADLSNMVEGDFIRLSTSQRSKVDGKDYKIEFKQANGTWPTYTTLWGPTHDAIWRIDDTAITAGIKDYPLYIYGELYNSNGVYLYHPVNSFKIGSIGMATFSANQEVTVPEGLTAYKAAVSGDNVTLTQFTNNVIPADHGAIIVGDEGSVVEFAATSTGSTEKSALEPVTTETDVTTLDSDYDYYVLYNNPTGGNVSLSLEDLNCGWESSYDKDTKTITFDDAWKGRGWGWNFDYSDYSKIVVEFESAPSEGRLKVQYNKIVNNNPYTEESSYSAGATSVEIELNDEEKNDVNQIYLSASAAGTLKLTNAYLVKNSGSAVPEFRKATTGKIAANKAYLKIEKSVTPSKLNIVFAEDENKQGEEQQGETNSIRNIANTNVNNNVVYNMNGQRVGSDYKGLVIVNGKKLLRK